MSIIHEALKRRDLSDRSAPVLQEVIMDRSSGAGSIMSGMPGMSGISTMGAQPSIEPASQLLPAFIGGGGVLLAALMTYLLTKPMDITVVVPPPAQPVPIATASLSASNNAAANQVLSDPFRGTVLAPDEEYAFQPIDAIPVTALSPLVSPQTFIAQPIARPAVSEPPAFPGIPVYTGRSTPVAAAAPTVAPTAQPSAAPTVTHIPQTVPTVMTTPAPSPGNAAPTVVKLSDLPPEAITIEMTEARLQSFAGPVTVNGGIPRPDERLRVGSEIKTAGTGEASVEFARAHVDLIGSSAAQIRRLERRIGPSGAPEEDVTLHVHHGTARTIVRPGTGSVLVSTDAVTAASSNGAFSMSAAKDGSVTIQNEGGVVKLVPSDRPNETYTLRGAERVTYRNGAFIRE